MLNFEYDLDAQLLFTDVTRESLHYRVWNGLQWKSACTALEASEFGLGYASAFQISFECLVKGDKAKVDVSNTFGYFED